MRALRRLCTRRHCSSAFFAWSERHDLEQRLRRHGIGGSPGPDPFSRIEPDFLWSQVASKEPEDTVPKGLGLPEDQHKMNIWFTLDGLEPGLVPG